MPAKALRKTNSCRKLRFHDATPVSPARRPRRTTHGDTRHALVQRITRDLSSTERVLLALRYHEGLAHPEIALVMDLSVAAVHRLHRRILTRLRAGIAGHSAVDSTN
jgi:DNA-directed RNA polymerase specialized sigma24 family protein